MVSEGVCFELLKFLPLWQQTIFYLRIMKSERYKGEPEGQAPEALAASCVSESIAVPGSGTR